MEIFNIFGKTGERYMRELIIGGLDNHLETMFYYLTLNYKFMSGYLYLLNNLKDIKTIYRLI